MILTTTIAVACLAFQGASTDIPTKYLPPKPDPKKVVARVNGVPITAADVNRLVYDWRGWEATQDLITYTMVAAEAKKAGVSVTQAEVDKELQVQLANYAKSLQPGMTLAQTLKETGFPKSRLWLRVKSQLLLDKVALKSLEPKNYVDVSTILVPTKSEQASDVAEAIKLSQQAYDDLKNGANWDTVLKRFQSNAEILKTHGHIGWRSLSAFPESVRKEIATLKEGGFTKPAATNNGIQIFRVDRFGASAAGAVLKELQDHHLQSTRQPTLDKIRKAAKIEDFWGKG